MGSEIAEEHGEECVGEAKAFIDEINAKDEELEEKPTGKAEIVVLTEVASAPMHKDSLKVNKSPPASEKLSQKFEEESKVHEADFSEEDDLSTDHEPKKVPNETAA